MSKTLKTVLLAILAIVILGGGFFTARAYKNKTWIFSKQVPVIEETTEIPVDITEEPVE